MVRLRGARYFIGTQGWNYPAWSGPFYPRGTRPADFLTLYARLFDTVEVDSSFYAVPSQAAIDSWVKRTPASFRFALKFPRAATHDDRLAGRESLETLAVFVDRVRGLGTRLGPILLQMPPDFAPVSCPHLDAFLEHWPADLALAVELRDPAWLTGDTFESLAARGIAPALTDSPHVPLPAMLDAVERAATGPAFAYVRWLGSRELVDYSRIQVDRTDELARWAAALPPLLDRGLDVYGYFNNHYAGHSPSSARTFLALVGETPPDPGDLEPQGSLF
ncbi:MAG: DUF72 domain-containing protein [Candidatus Eisenbacteria bacterium]